jgi:hypothetical protein
VRFDPKSLEVGSCFFLFLKILLGSIAFAVFCYFQSIRLPAYSEILPSSRLAPEQSEVAEAKFSAFVKGESYQIFTKARYRIRGLVVSLHDSEFMDITHAAAKDFINTHDLCIVWGDNAMSPYLKEINFSSGNWTCYFQTKSEAAWKSFKKDEISNNHILPSTTEIEKIIATARVGDQIELAGMLVDYGLPNGGKRKSSLVRDDVEDGACEIIYVTEAKILARGSKFWHGLRRLGEIAAVISVLGILFSLFILPKLQNEKTPSF